MTGEKIAAVARGWLGTPYHHQAAVKGAGCDCLGLIRGVYAEVTGREPEAAPPYSRDWGEMRGEETLLGAARRHLREVSKAGAQPGDVLIFRMKKGAMAKHSGIATETRDGVPARMVHAQEGVGVAEINLSRWWTRRIAAIFRFEAQER